MPARFLTHYLQNEHVPFKRIPHYRAFTSQEIAAAAHVPGRLMTKTLVMRVDGVPTLIVIPSSHRLRVEDLRRELDADSVTFVEESEFPQLFPDSEVGAMPPFGNLYGMDVYVADCLDDKAVIYFNAGSHSELIQMNMDDFVRLARPRMISCSQPV